nr:PREDICTED: uncharacterized protein LOC109040302 [Bemisia tabaci]
MYGCTLKGLAKTRPPEAIVYPDPTIGEWVLEGTGGKLLKIAMEKLNFRTNISIPPNNTKIDRFGYDISTGIPNALDEAINKLEVDFAFGRVHPISCIYSHIIYDSADAEFSRAVTEECFTWVVPDKAGRIPSIWSNYINEFDIGVWSLIIVTFATISVSIYVTTHLIDTSGELRKLRDIVFYGVATSLAVSSPAQPETHSLRLLIFQWLLYCLVISAAYQSSLGSFMTVPWSTDQIRELQQILDGRFNITGQPQAGRILKRSATENPVLQRLSQKFVIHAGFYDDVIDLIEAGTTASFGAKRFIQFYSINRLRKRNAILHIIPECVLQAHSSPFMFRKGSVLELPINRIISGLVESGITDYWFEYSIPKSGLKLENVRALQINQIKGLLIILFCGHTMAAIVLLLEKAHRYWTVRSGKKKRVAFVDSMDKNDGKKGEPHRMMHAWN